MHLTIAKGTIVFIQGSVYHRLCKWFVNHRFYTRVRIPSFVYMVRKPSFQGSGHHRWYKRLVNHRFYTIQGFVYHRKV